MSKKQEKDQIPEDLKKILDFVYENREKLQEELGICAKEIARDNSQFGFLAAVALLKHLSIRLDAEDFGPIVLRWVSDNVERAKESPLWQKAFTDTSDQCDCFLQSLDEDDEEDDE